jgi:hypothetical protein
LKRSPRFPLSELIPSARFQNETALSGEWPNHRQLAVQLRAKGMKFRRRSRLFSAADDFRRVHLPIVLINSATGIFA